MRRFWWVGVGLVLVLMLAGVQRIGLREATARVPQLVLATPSGPSTFNYALNTTLYSVFGFIYEGLLRQNGVTAEMEPALAESWTIAPDKKTIRFTLRPGLRWSDGRPLTAADVVFSYQEVYLNPAIPSSVQDILRIGETGAFPTVRQLDERRVEFTVPEPFAPFLRFAGGIPILPAHALRPAVTTQNKDGQLAFLSTWGTDTPVDQIVGNGPYRMERYTPGQRVVFRRNPHYWQKDAAGRPMPLIERLVWQIIESTDTQLLRFRSGELDGLEVAGEAFPLLKREEKPGQFTIYNGGPQNVTTFLAFNQNRARGADGKPLVDPVKSRWFTTREFRQAVAYAIDRERMRDTIFRGLGELQNSPLDPNGPYYLSPAEGLRVYEYRPQEAKALLKRAGFRYSPAGKLLDWDGNPVRFTLLTNVERRNRPAMAAQIKDDLARVGMQVDVQTMSFNPYVERIRRARNFDCYLGGFGGGSIDPQGGFNIWSSRGGLHNFNLGPQRGEPPLQGWEVTPWEQRIDQLFIQGAQELDESRRKAIYAEFQRVAQDNLPFIHLVNALDLEAVRNRIQGVRHSAIGGAFWNLPELSVAEDMRP